VFAALTPHRQPSPKNGLRHFSALPTHHPTPKARKSVQNGQRTTMNKILLRSAKNKKYFFKKKLYLCQIIDKKHGSLYWAVYQGFAIA